MISYKQLLEYFRRGRHGELTTAVTSINVNFGKRCVNNNGGKFATVAFNAVRREYTRVFSREKSMAAKELLNPGEDDHEKNLKSKIS
jgi:hypothetical protein